MAKLKLIIPILRDKRHVYWLKEGKKSIYETSRTSRIRLAERRIDTEKIVCYIFFIYRCHCLFMSCLFYVFFRIFVFVNVKRERYWWIFFFNDSIVWIFAYCLYCFDVYFLYRLYYVDLLNALYTRRWWCRCVPQFRSLTGTNDLVWISRECRKRKLILVFFFGKHNADDWYGTISSFAQLVVLYLLHLSIRPVCN